MALGILPSFLPNNGKWFIYLSEFFVHHGKNAIDRRLSSSE